MNTATPSESTAVARPASFYSADGYCANDSVGYLMRRVLLALTIWITRRRNAGLDADAAGDEDGHTDG